MPTREVLRPSIGLGLLFAWLLSVPLAGPLLAAVEPPGLGPLSTGEVFAGAHGLGLLAVAAWGAFRPLPKQLPWGASIAGVLGIAAAALPGTLWPPLLAVAGVFAAFGVAAVGAAIARLPWEERPSAVAFGALLANVALYAVSSPDLDLPARPAAAVLAVGAVFVPMAVPATLAERPPRTPVPWRQLGALLPAVFASYLVGGVMYAVVLPTLGGLGMRIGSVPYMVVLPLAAWAAVRFGRGWTARPGLGLLGLGFAAWAMTAAGARDAAAQTLIVSGYAFLDVAFWSAFADRQGPPAVSIGLGLGTMVVAIFAGMLLSDTVAEAALGREEEVALIAGMALLAAAVVMPLLPYDRPRGEEETGTEFGRLAARFGLTSREVQVAVLAARGLSNKEIAQALGLSPGTVRKHLERAYRKLHVRSRTEAGLVLRVERSTLEGAAQPEGAAGNGTATRGSPLEDLPAR